MNERGQDSVATGSPLDIAPDTGHKDHFLQLMFFQAHPPEPVSYLPRRPDRATGDYAPLRRSLAKPGDRYVLPLAGRFASIALDAPAYANAPSTFVSMKLKKGLFCFGSRDS